jgi:hypothetical protein
MPPIDASSAPTLPDLGRVLLSWLEHADLCEVLRKRVQVVGLRADLGLPRRATSETCARWLSGSHLLCELANRERFGARACFFALPVDQAAGLLDRALGGSGQIGVAGVAGTLSDAECGVLAHLAAQVCTTRSAALTVRDVFCADAGKLRALCAEGALWPLRIAASPERETPRAEARSPRAAQRQTSADLVLDAKLLFAAPDDCPTDRYTLALSVQDALAPETLTALQVGDLLASDVWPLALSARGLEGMLALGVDGIAERAAAALSGTRVTCGHPHAAHAPARNESVSELRLYDGPVSFWQLAELAGGGTLELPDGPRVATLYVAGQPRAAGDLVRLRGAIALRVSELFSATRSESAASSASPRASDPG